MKKGRERKFIVFYKHDFDNKKKFDARNGREEEKTYYNSNNNK